MTVQISWTAAADPVDGYNVYRGTATGQETLKLNTALVTGLVFTDTAPVVGHDFYVIKSVIGSVESLPSSEVVAIILPLAPSNLTALAA